MKEYFPQPPSTWSESDKAFWRQFINILERRMENKQNKFSVYQMDAPVSIGLVPVTLHVSSSASLNNAVRVLAHLIFDLYNKGLVKLKVD